MEINKALEYGIIKLKEASIEAPVFEAGVMLCDAIRKDKVFLYAHPEYMLAPQEEKAYLESVSRRADHTPLQYIRGVQEFMSLEYKVNSNVLIPRQDTEIIVEAVIEHCRCINTGGEKIEILDIGTGSGCIAVSLAYYIENCRVLGVDISEGALEVAKGNSEANGVSDRVTFIKSNIFEKIEEHFANYEAKNKFDVIVSNPPYIPVEEIAVLAPEVKEFEPYSALCGGDDGLEFYREIVNGSRAFLKPEGLLAFETGYNQAGLVAELMKKSFRNIKITKDFSGIERCVTGLFIPDLY